MKKNKMMRAASGLLVATLLTTSVISGTFAKYTTTTSGSDQARVAYWGFNQDAKTTIDLFDGEYTNVKSENNENVVAPGTEKTSTFAFAYKTNAKATKPEVAYNFKVNADITGSYTALDDNESFKWTLKKGDGTATEYNTVAALKTAIEELAGADATNGSKDYAAGELPEAFKNGNDTYTVGWKWAFDGQDTKDTTMGNATDLANVKLQITITATQID